MNNKKIVIRILLPVILFLLFGVAESFAQPSDAQLKKQLTSAKTVSVTLGGPGKIAWSKTYKKYMWTRNFTAKLKTDTAGEILVVKGYAAYDVMGGRYVFWRTFTSSNSYEGKNTPTVAELNKLVEKMQLRDIHNQWEYFFIGEIESLKISSFPKWEWHTPNSVSFDVVMIHSMIYNGGSYNGEAQESASPDVFVDRVERIQRWRIYRDDEKQPWKSATATEFGNIGDTMRDENNNLIYRLKLLGRKKVSRQQADKMPSPTKVPVFTE